MFSYKTPAILHTLFPSLTWMIDTDTLEVSLTFDDGPVAGVTDWVLSVLNNFDVRATFFCVGEHVLDHPDLIQKIAEEGHSVGNHTHTHLNSWTTSFEKYHSNIMKCEEALAPFNKGRLFRPPYGKLRPLHIKKLKNEFKIIMWNVLTGDYRPDVDPASCLNGSLMAVSGGSIIVFHDSLKASRLLKTMLPGFIDKLLKQGYTFKPL